MGIGKTASTGRSKRIAFVSSNLCWGGSEELWCASAAALSRDGELVSVYKNHLEEDLDCVAALRAASCRLSELGRFPFLPRRAFSFLISLSPPTAWAYLTARLCLKLLFRRPHLIVISQGGNHDGWLFGNVCLTLGIPFVLICHKASDQSWPRDKRLPRIRRMFEGARHCFFVSEHTRRLTCEQLGLTIESSSLVRNPYLVPWAPRNDWPSSRKLVRFACVGRLNPAEKGQDILLRVMAREKWRRRPVSVTFFGRGERDAGLRGMALLLGLKNIRFAGFVNDVASIWDDHQCLVLPSREEGVPLALVEAMMSGRIPVVTDSGGNRELVDDNCSGFLAAAPTANALDEAMERAWLRQSEWRSIGERAAQRIREIVPRDPAKEFSKALMLAMEELCLMKEPSGRSHPMSDVVRTINHRPTAGARHSGLTTSTWNDPGSAGARPPPAGGGPKRAAGR